MAHIYNIRYLRTRLERQEPQCYCHAALASRRFLDQELSALRNEYSHPKILCLDFLVPPNRTNTSSSTYSGTAANWDFIYSCELLGRIPDVAAKQAVKAAWSCLKPGGRLLLANTNLTDHISVCSKCASAGRAYRTELELAELAKDLPHTLLAGKVVFRDDSGLNAYLELSKSNPRRGPDPLQ